MQSPLKMGELMHSPMKIQHLTLPEKTKPTQTSLDQKICLVPNLGLGDLGLTWHLFEPGPSVLSSYDGAVNHGV